MPQYQDLQVLGAVIAFGRTSGRISRRTVSHSMKSIEGWCGTLADGANPRFRAPHAARARQNAAETRGGMLTGDPTLDTQYVHSGVDGAPRQHPSGS